jgi:acetylornithine/N-succinyldiaminopimelate aminotransferase
MIGAVLNIPAKPVEAKLRENGLLCIATGDHVLRFVPPLVVTPAHIQQALAILDRSL